MPNGVTWYEPRRSAQWCGFLWGRPTSLYPTYLEKPRARAVEKALILTCPKTLVRAHILYLSLTCTFVRASYVRVVERVDLSHNRINLVQTGHGITRNVWNITNPAMRRKPAYVTAYLKYRKRHACADISSMVCVLGQQQCSLQPMCRLSGSLVGQEVNLAHFHAVPVLEDQLSPRTRRPPGHAVLGPDVPPDTPWS